MGKCAKGGAIGGGPPNPPKRPLLGVVFFFQNASFVKCDKTKHFSI